MTDHYSSFLYALEDAFDTVSTMQSVQSFCQQTKRAIEYLRVTNAGYTAYFIENPSTDILSTLSGLDSVIKTLEDQHEALHILESAIVEALLSKDHDHERITQSKADTTSQNTDATEHGYVADLPSE